MRPRATCDERPALTAAGFQRARQPVEEALHCIRIVETVAGPRRSPRPRDEDSNACRAEPAKGVFVGGVVANVDRAQATAVPTQFVQQPLHGPALVPVDGRLQLENFSAPRQAQPGPGTECVFHNAGNAGNLRLPHPTEVCREAKAPAFNPAAGHTGELLTQYLLGGVERRQVRAAGLDDYPEGRVSRRGSSSRSSSSSASSVISAAISRMARRSA
jgi:hypothetical protein